MEDHYDSFTLEAVYTDGTTKKLYGPLCTWDTESVPNENGKAGACNVSPRDGFVRAVTRGGTKTTVSYTENGIEANA